MKKLGIIIIIAVFAMALLATGAFAGANSELIQAYINHDIKLTVNGAKFTPKDSDGNTLEPIIYNGSTYLPVRALANAIGGSATWDDKTQTVAIQVGPTADVPYKDAGSSQATAPPTTVPPAAVPPIAQPKLLFTEDFESGSKRDINNTADVDLSSGSWKFEGAALLDFTDERDPDIKNDRQAVRIIAPGFISMNFDVAGANTVKVKHARRGFDNGTLYWKLEKSTDGGSTWKVASGDFFSSSKLTEETISVNYSGKIRFKISVWGTSSDRINIDDFSIYN